MLNARQERALPLESFSIRIVSCEGVVEKLDGDCATK